MTEWVPCSERMPFDGVTVLAAVVQGASIGEIWVLFRDRGRWRWADDGEPVENDDDWGYWRPLPRLPDEILEMITADD